MDDKALTNDVADFHKTFPKQFDPVEASAGRRAGREVTDVPHLALSLRLAHARRAKDARKGREEGSAAVH